MVATITKDWVAMILDQRKGPNNMSIDIGQLTFAQLKEIAAIVGGACKSKKVASTCDERPVIVRSYGAGAFFGYLAEKRGNEVLLVRCRRIWNWKGANTLSEIALHGITPQGSRVAEPTPRHRVLDVVEIIDAQPEAVKNLEAAKWSA